MFYHFQGIGRGRPTIRRASHPLARIRKSTMQIRFNFHRNMARQLLLGACASAFIGAYLPWMAYGEELPRVASVNGQPPDNRLIIRSVRNLVEEMHISQGKFNDELSKRGFDLFLKQVDPLKSYLLQSDIDEFRQYETQLDDMLLKNNISFAYTVYKRFLQRLNEVVPIIHEEIDRPQDYGIQEYIESDAKSMKYASNMDELRDRWRKTIKLNYLSARADGDKDEETREKLHKRYRTYYKIRSQTDVYELLEMYLTALTSAMDPHTTYMAPREKDNFDMHISLKLKGIGATLRPDDGSTIVDSIVPGGAADKDGRLKEGDEIVAVQQEDGTPPVETLDMKVDDVVSMIRGEAGTKVKLHVKPKAGGERQIYEITRAIIKLEDSAAQSEIVERGQKPDGSPYRIGFIKLPSFYLDMEGARSQRTDYRRTSRDMAVILKSFNESNVDAVVLDLSRNGGGSLPEAIAATGLFIDSGPVVQVKDPNGRVLPMLDDDSSIAWRGPLIVKTSQLSASASEIFAGAIQDYQRGLIVGDPKTHGKGTVQTLMDLAPALFGAGATKPLGALKLTIQQFYLPDGRSTQLEGVAADIIVPSMIAEMDLSESDLDFPIPMDSVKAQPHKNYLMVDSAMKNQLQQKSTERITASEEFTKLLSRIDAYRKQKSEELIPLQESDYMARRKELRTEKEEEQQLDPKAERDKIFASNFYNEEIVNIAIDYIKALQSANKLVTK
jgi:carboxyl-terminal processing protease